MQTNGWPVPTGPGYTFAKVPPAGSTQKFDLMRANYLVVFQPVDVNDPGTLILYDINGAAMVTLNAGGYATFRPLVSAQTGYYFTASKGANMAAIVEPYTGGRN